MKYPRSVEAARGIGISKMDLAEALAAEIPPRRTGPTPRGSQSIPDQLQAAAAEILAETGESYEWRTLEEYRNVALWVSRGAPWNWAPASWTAHVEAYKKGESFQRFEADPTTKRRVRERNGGSTGDVPAAARAINENPAEADKLVAGLDDAGLDALAEASLRQTASRAGVTLQPHRDVPDPRPKWATLTQRIGLDIRTTLTLIGDLRDEGQTALADRALQELRDVLIDGVARTEHIPDTIEGIR